MLVEKIKDLSPETLETKKAAAKKFASKIAKVLELRAELERMREHNKKRHVFPFSVTEFENQKEQIAKEEEKAQQFYKILLS